MKTFTKLKALLTVSALSLLASASFAQTASSFQSVTTSGLYYTSASANSYQVSALSTASMTYQGVSYKISDVFGFFEVATTGSFTNASASSTPSGWAFSGPSGKGDTVGWTDNSKKEDILAGSSQSFAFSLITPTSGAVTSYGYHVRVTGTFADGSNTLFIFDTSHGHSQAVPEPAPVAILSVGVFGLVFGKRRKVSR